MQSIHRVRHVSLEAACHAIWKLVTTRLLPDLSAASETEVIFQTWIEKACVTYTLFATSSIDATSDFVIAGLEDTLNAVVQRSNTAFSPKATHAAQALIWKAAGTADPDTGDRWCRLLRHPLFDGAGQVNKARVGRYVTLLFT